jgi:hypothetical protein
MLFQQKKIKGHDIAEQLLKSIDMDDVLDLVRDKDGPDVADKEGKLELLLGLCACNLAQTMRADFIVAGCDPAVQYDAVRYYITGLLKRQNLVKVKDDTDADSKRKAVIAVMEDLQKFWKEEEDPKGSGPGPRYYCVKEVLKRLGGGPDYDLHDNLFEMMYTRHKFYIDFFRKLLA